MANVRFEKLKRKYDFIGIQISSLHEEQRKIQDLMEEACTHERLDVIAGDPFLIANGIESGEIKYKCKDCFIYI